MTDKPFQRKGSKSNTHIGKQFEEQALGYFQRQGINLTRGFGLLVGINGQKVHKFDLGDETNKTIVECKTHTWTEGNNVPSAKISKWNEAMFLFHAASSAYRRILFVRQDYSASRNETLAEYYVRVNSHLIPRGVEIWEYDEIKKIARKVNSD